MPPRVPLAETRALADSSQFGDLVPQEVDLVAHRCLLAPQQVVLSLQPPGHVLELPLLFLLLLAAFGRGDPVSFEELVSPDFAFGVVVYG